jgi:hypothetical protein
MTQQRFVDAIIGLGNAAKGAGLSDPDQAMALLVAALAIADRNSREGCDRDTFIKMAAVVHDKVRRSLAGGAEAG